MPNGCRLSLEPAGSVILDLSHADLCSIPKRHTVNPQGTYRKSFVISDLQCWGYTSGNPALNGDRRTPSASWQARSSSSSSVVIRTRDSISALPWSHARSTRIIRLASIRPVFAARRMSKMRHARTATAAPRISQPAPDAVAPECVLPLFVSLQIPGLALLPVAALAASRDGPAAGQPEFGFHGCR